MTNKVVMKMKSTVLAEVEICFIAVVEWLQLFKMESRNIELKN